MNVADEIQKLQQLRQTGAITEEEFAVAKARLINSPPADSHSVGAPAPSAADVERETRLWGMILHLSVLAGHVVPYAGLVAPIVTRSRSSIQSTGSRPTVVLGSSAGGQT